MRVVKFWGGVLLMLLASSFANETLPKSFTDLLSRADMMFEAPPGLTPVSIIQNRSMNYEYALKYPGKNFEIRYAVRPSDDLWKQYEQNKKNQKPGDINTDPDSIYTSALQTIILNTSPGELPPITSFEQAAVKSEFNADWGGTVFIHPRKEFGQEYKYCMIVALHKSHAGEAYIFYLSDSKEGFNEMVAPAFHSLKFNSI